MDTTTIFNFTDTATGWQKGFYAFLAEKGILPNVSLLQVSFPFIGTLINFDKYNQKTHSS